MVIVVLVAIFATVTVSASSLVPRFSVEFSQEEYERGEKLTFTLSIDEETDLSAFKIDVKYDGDALEFLEAEAFGDVYFNEHDTLVKTQAIYAVKDDKDISGEICEFSYRVDEDIISNFSNIEIEVSEMIMQDSTVLDVKYITQVTAKITPKDLEDAKILSLTPSSGALSPNFDSETLNYSVSVPYSVNEMEFDVEVSVGASFTVNRKNLGSGGSTTSFKISVTAQDDVTKNEYIIDVTRGEYNPQSVPDSEDSGQSADETLMPKLLELSPSVGELNEDFSSDVYEYTMDVPYEVSSMSFTYLVDSEVDVSINRKNLGSGGSTEDFIITAKLGDEKVQYTVLVTRGEYVRPSAQSEDDASAHGADESEQAETKHGETDDIVAQTEEGAQTDETTGQNEGEVAQASSSQLVVNSDGESDLFLILIVIATGLVIMGCTVFLHLSNRKLILERNAKHTKPKE